jgi:hypothetical protein
VSLVRGKVGGSGLTNVKKEIVLGITGKGWHFILSQAKFYAILH